MPGGVDMINGVLARYDEVVPIERRGACEAQSGKDSPNRC